MANILEQVQIRNNLLISVLGEKQYRLYLAAEAKALGWGGVSQVARATSASRNTISSGLDELMRPSVSKPIEDLVEEKKTRGRTRGRRLPVADDARQRRRGGGA